MKTIFFDVETGPLPEAELAMITPPFDPAEVKTGNLKDPEKVAAKLAEARENQRRNFHECAALDPMTGRVAAVGLLFQEDKAFRVIGDEDEAKILTEFWRICRDDHGALNQMVGFNIHLFDLPFLIRRSWKHRLVVPLGLRRGRYWTERMVDLREEWQLGDRQARGSLDTIAKHLGVGKKSDHGKNFFCLWQTDREKAIHYLRNDLELTAALAEALGCVSTSGNPLHAY